MRRAGLRGGGRLLPAPCFFALAFRRRARCSGLAVGRDIGIVGARLVCWDVRVRWARRILTGIIGRRLILGARLLLLLVWILVLLSEASRWTNHQRSRDYGACDLFHEYLFANLPAQNRSLFLIVFAAV